MNRGQKLALLTLAIDQMSPPTHEGEMTNEDKGDEFFMVRIPRSMLHYSDDIRRFVDAMIYKLEKNAHKGKWENLTVIEAMRLLEDEVEELKKEIGGNSVKTILEAADVANFALMVANIAVERGK